MAGTGSAGTEGLLRGAAQRARPTVLGALLGTAAGAILLGTFGWGGCGSEPPPGPSAELPGEPTRSDAVRATAPSASASSSSSAVAADDTARDGDAGAPLPPWTGPWLGATAQITPVYATTRFANERLGYLRRGGRAPVDSSPPVKTASCKEGWHKLVDGGYVCGRYATLNLEDPRIRLGVTAPNLDASLPYRYAYNNAHGTPLYRVVPSREEMLRYEPYLLDKKKSKPDEAAATEAMTNADQPTPMATGKPLDGPGERAEGGSNAFAAASSRASATASVSTASVAELDGGDEAPPPDLAWWQRVDGGGPVEVKLADLEEGSGTLSRRMVKGFFVAIDRTLGANNRMWYKSTSGLIAPADRMVIPKTPELAGLEVPEGAKQVGFVLASKAKKYRLDEEGKRPKTVGSIDRFTAVGLTGTTRLVDKQRFHETVDGWWLRGNDATWTDPGKRPSSVGPSEKWIDVNLTRKTLVAMIGDRPVYAALISPGKRSEDKRRDHRTPTGSFRIREKHIAVTMDGDAVVAGDAPYSIEDVPYVQYYDGSFALHGAFWHQNFGREQSHGCVNLAPRDAKWLFFWSEPSLPRGWHGVWSGNGRRGSLVVVHE